MKTSLITLVKLLPLSKPNPEIKSKNSTSTPSELEPPTTTPPQTELQLTLIFRNFELKYLKLAKEILIFYSNKIHVSIKDLKQQNQTFLAENVDKSSGKRFISVSQKYNLKLWSMYMISFMQNETNLFMYLYHV